MTVLFFRLLLGLVFCLATITLGVGQHPQQNVAGAKAASESQATLRVFRQEQQALDQERETLINQGATQKQIQAWRQQNASRFAAQQQRMQILTKESASAEAILPPPLVIPANSTPQMARFLTLRHQLTQDRIQWRNQYAQAAPAARQQAMKQWRINNATNIQQLQRQAQDLGQADSTSQ